MRRWSGWGDTSDDYLLTDDARAFLRDRVGESTPRDEPSWDDALGQVPASRLSSSDVFDTGAEARLLHARGQSFPDWLAMKSGRFGPFADAVAMPQSHAEAAAALAAAREAGAEVIPYGGGTSVVGHLTVPESSDRPVVNISLERMNKLESLDPENMLARFGAGTPGPQLEAQLRAHGWMLGHYPQSFEYSTVGGWVVTRSSGQQSLRYGRIEQLFASGRLATPRGELPVGGVPASSAGPDLRETVMGSEGRLGLLTEATVRVRPLPERDEFHGIFFPSWDCALAAIRELAQSGIALSMLRLSNAVETETQLRLAAGHANAIKWLERYLGWRNVAEGKCMLMAGMTGSSREVRRLRADTQAICRRHHGVATGQLTGKGWAKNRFRGPYLRNSLWAHGYAADTVETCVNWTETTATMSEIESAARDALAGFDERVHAFTHLSHVYRQGCSVYSTFVFRAAPTPEENLERWRVLKSRVSQAVVEHGGTISHQHGVGTDHAPYLEAEKHALGMDMLRAMAREFDPDGMMNPGKLIP